MFSDRYLLIFPSSFGKDWPILKLVLGGAFIYYSGIDGFPVGFYVFIGQNLFPHRRILPVFGCFVKFAMELWGFSLGFH